jgi:hypothetical protein
MFFFCKLKMQYGLYQCSWYLQNANYTPILMCDSFRIAENGSWCNIQGENEIFSKWVKSHVFGKFYNKNAHKIWEGLYFTAAILIKKNPSINVTFWYQKDLLKSDYICIFYDFFQIHMISAILNLKIYVFYCFIHHFF